jgi:subtilisin family serine protease
MKKAFLGVMLAAVLLVSAVIPVVAAQPESEGMLLLQPALYKAELAFGLEGEGGVEAQNGAGETPFWVDMVNAEYYPDGGEDVYVAILDTGLLEMWEFFFGHANIADEWGIGFTHDVYWDDGLGEIVWDPLRDDRGFITGDLNSGHGTHLTSTVVGYNFNNLFVVDGVAPKATIIPVLVMDAWYVEVPEWYADDGYVLYAGGTDEMVAAGINYVADLAEAEGIKIVINMSLGGPEPSAMIEDAIDYAISKGVIVVASAGNEGYDGMGWPGAYPQVISAAAGGWTEQWLERPPQTRWWLNDVTEELGAEDYWGNNSQMYLEDFSSRPNLDLGQEPFQLDVTAPGASIVGPYKSYFSTAIGYYYLWGTSMAAPHVAGMASVVLGEYPHLNQYQMEFILKNAAHGLPLAADGAWLVDPWYGLYHFEWFGDDYGAGWLTADRAMARADILTRGRFRA